MDDLPLEALLVEPPAEKTQRDIEAEIERDSISAEDFFGGDRRDDSAEDGGPDRADKNLLLTLLLPPEPRGAITTAGTATAAAGAETRDEAEGAIAKTMFHLAIGAGAHVMGCGGLAPFLSWGIDKLIEYAEPSAPPGDDSGGTAGRRTDATGTRDRDGGAFTTPADAETGSQTVRERPSARTGHDGPTRNGRFLARGGETAETSRFPQTGHGLSHVDALGRSSAETDPAGTVLATYGVPWDFVGSSPPEPSDSSGPWSGDIGAARFGAVDSWPAGAYVDRLVLVRDEDSDAVDVIVRRPGGPEVTLAFRRVDHFTITRTAEAVPGTLDHLQVTSVDPRQGPWPEGIAPPPHEPTRPGALLWLRTGGHVQINVIAAIAVILSRKHHACGGRVSQDHDSASPNRIQQPAS